MKLPHYVSIMTEALSAQTQQINELTEYFHTKSEIDKQILNIESMELVMARPVNQSIMMESFKKMMEVQSESIILLRRMLTSQGNSSCGLRYKEDENGLLIAAETCSCMPEPPEGLEMTSISYSCRNMNTSTYNITCSDTGCATDTWPHCRAAVEEEQFEWEYQDCEEVSVPYLEKNVSCNTPGKTGWKTGSVRTIVGQGVFTFKEQVSCSDCDV